MLGAFIGESIRKVAPMAAFYAPMMGVGFVYLAFVPMLAISQEPMMCLIPLLIVFNGFFGGVRYHIYKSLSLSLLQLLKEQLLVSQCFIGCFFILSSFANETPGSSPSPLGSWQFWQRSLPAGLEHVRENLEQSAGGTARRMRIASHLYQLSQQLK